MSVVLYATQRTQHSNHMHVQSTAHTLLCHSRQIAPAVSLDECPVCPPCAKTPTASVDLAARLHQTNSTTLHTQTKRRLTLPHVTCSNQRETHCRLSTKHKGSCKLTGNTSWNQTPCCLTKPLYSLTSPSTHSKRQQHAALGAPTGRALRLALLLTCCVRPENLNGHRNQTETRPSSLTKNTTGPMLLHANTHPSHRMQAAAEYCCNSYPS
jgi:hypothetical protein